MLEKGAIILTFDKIKAKNSKIHCIKKHIQH